MDWLEKLETEETKQWEEVMLSFSFDQEEWNDARTLLLKLLKNDKKRAEEQAIRSYMSCCAESAGNVHPLPALASLVEELYQTYGMENAKEERLVNLVLRKREQKREEIREEIRENPIRKKKPRFNGDFAFGLKI